MLGGFSEFLCYSVWWEESKSAACLSSLHLDCDLGRHLFESSRELILFWVAFHHCLAIHSFAVNIFFGNLIIIIFVASGFLYYFNSLL